MFSGLSLLALIEVAIWLTIGIMAAGLVLVALFFGFIIAGEAELY